MKEEGSDNDGDQPMKEDDALSDGQGPDNEQIEKTKAKIKEGQLKPEALN